MPELSDILPVVTSREVGADLLAGLGKKENPVSVWIELGVLRTMYELTREITFDLVASAIPLMERGVFTDTASQADDAWLTLLARHWYDRTRTAPTVAIQTITLSRVAGTGSDPITAGRTAFLSTDGKRYIASSGGTIAGGGTLGIDVQGEGPGAGRGLVDRLETALAGVTVTAAAFKIISSVTQFGSDEEGNASLAERCDSRWPDLEAVPEEDRVVKWAKAAHVDVTRVRLLADAVNPGGVIVILAGASGGVGAPVVTTVQAYVDARQAITDLNTCIDASNLAVDCVGTVKYPTGWGATELAAAKAAADAAWTAYLAGTVIGGKVRRTELVQAIMDVGAIDTDATLDSAGPDGNLNLAGDQVPIPGDMPSSMTWEVF